MSLNGIKFPMNSTTTHLTHCPSCGHTFNITEEQLSLKSGYARCGNCEKIFSAIDNILTVGGVATPVTMTTSVTKSGVMDSSSAPDGTTLTKTASIDPISPNHQLDESRVLFDDDLGLEDTMATDNAKSLYSSKNSSVDDTADFEIIDNFDTLANSATVGFSQTPTQSVDSDDEAWLTDLLEADNKRPDSVIDNKLTPLNRQNNDVTSMLEDLGVGVKYEMPPSQDEYQQKLDQRLSAQVASQSRVKTGSGMTAVWAIGSLLLGLALLVQYMLFNMNELVKDPSKAGHIATLCSIIQCKPPLADTNAIDVKTLSINSASDPQKSDMILALKNTTQQNVLFPNLKVTLREGNATKAQFVLTPSQYTEANNVTMLSGQIQPLKLRIDYPKSKFEQANVDVFY